MIEPKPRRRGLIYFTIRSLCWLFHKITTRAVFLHADRVPASGAYLIVANHQSFLDPPLVGCNITQRDITYLARASLFNNPIFGGILKRINVVPIRDEEGDIQAIRDIIARLKNGEAVLMFPEGSRSFDGLMVPFRDGAALIMRRAKCPVIPVAVEGAFDAMPRTGNFIKPGSRTMVMFGHPIPYEDLKGTDINSRLQNEIESMRLVLRKELRRKTGGRFPANGLGDQEFGSADSSAGGSASSAG
jgi:1-acyl-sn-glycerol-3-phosphate acyltransferase